LRFHDDAPKGYSKKEKKFNAIPPRTREASHS
jgi:hypothetical protein